MEDYVEREAVEEGFRFAAAAVAARALHGEMDSKSLGKGLEVPVSGEGEKETGSLEPGDGVAVPNRVVEDPVNTVGLGDVASACSFVLENAMSR